MSFKTVNDLSNEHQIVFQRLQALAKPAEELDKGTGGIQEIREFSTFLEKDVALHFDIEEKALFPVLGRIIGSDSGPVYVMLMEHEDLMPKFRELIELSRNLNTSDDGSRKKAVKLTRYIINSLYNHAQKEDQILFPFALNALVPEQQAEVDSAAEKLKISIKIT